VRFTQKYSLLKLDQNKKLQSTKLKKTYELRSNFPPPHPTLPKLIGLPENSYKTPQDSNRRFKPTHLAKELETKQQPK
jgi:hypothetical protein